MNNKIIYKFIISLILTCLCGLMWTCVIRCKVHMNKNNIKEIK
jgi:hypothetical protein